MDIHHASYYTVCQSTGWLTDWLVFVVWSFYMVFISFCLQHRILFLNNFLDFQYRNRNRNNNININTNINKWKNSSSSLSNKKITVVRARVSFFLFKMLTVFFLSLQIHIFLVFGKTNEYAPNSRKCCMCTHLYICVEYWCVISPVRKYETFEVFRFSDFIYPLREWHIQYAECVGCVM